MGHFHSAQGRFLMPLLPHPPRTVRIGLATLILALELATVAPAPSLAQSQPGAPPPNSVPGQASVPAGVGTGAGEDYPVSGGPTHGAGWFYTQEATKWRPIIGLGPLRARGYAVLDDDKANFW